MVVNASQKFLRNEIVPYLDCCYTMVFFPFFAENDSHWKMTYDTSFIDDIFANIWQIFQKMGPSAWPDGDLAKMFFFPQILSII